MALRRVQPRTAALLGICAMEALAVLPAQDSSNIHGWLLVVLAAPANMLALIVVNFPTWAFDTSRYGGAFAEVLVDSQEFAAHATLLALGGFAAVTVLAPQQIPDLPDDLSPREALRMCLRVVFGPPRTFWPRFGAALSAGVFGAAAFVFLTSETMRDLLESLSFALCGEGLNDSGCQVSLREFFDHAAPESSFSDPLLERLSTFIALECFVGLFCFSYFGVRVAGGQGSRRVSVFVSSWSAYTVAAFGYCAIMDRVSDVANGENSPLDVVPILTQPTGLPHSMVFGPLVAAAITVLAVLFRRQGPERSRVRAPERQSAQEASPR